LHSYRLSVPATESVPDDSDLARYQSIHWQSPLFNRYKYHLKEFKEVTKNKQKNVMMTAASWRFRQLLDGLNVAQGISVGRHIY
jgi:hypothetical protein